MYCCNIVSSISVSISCQHTVVKINPTAFALCFVLTHIIQYIQNGILVYFDTQQATILPIENKPEPDTSLTPATSSLMANESESGMSIGKNDFHHKCMGQVIWWCHTRLYLLYIYVYVYIDEENISSYQSYSQLINYRYNMVWVLINVNYSPVLWWSLRSGPCVWWGEGWVNLLTRVVKGPHLITRSLVWALGRDYIDPHIRSHDPTPWTMLKCLAVHDF